MAETVTLQLSDDMARSARETARRTGRQVEDVLTDPIRRAVADDDMTLLVPGAGYPIYTPYGNEAVAQGLLDALHAEEGVTHTADQEYVDRERASWDG